MPADDSRPHSGRRTVLFAGGVVAAIAVVYVGLATGGSDRVPANTIVLGHDIGDRTAAEAAAYLDEKVAKAASRPVVLVVDGKRTSLKPAQLGLSFDATATVAAVTGDRWSPSQLMKRFVGTTEVPPVIRVDEAKLREVLGDIADSVDRKAENADVVMEDGEPTLVRGSTGRGLDQKQAERDIVASYLLSTKPVTLRIKPVSPIITNAEAQRVLEEVAEPAVAEPVVITASGKTGSARGEYPVGSVLRFDVKGDKLVPVINGDELKKMLRSEFSEVERAGRDATFKIVDGKPMLVSSTVGYGIEPEPLARAVEGVLTKQGDERTVSAVLGPIKPDRTTDQIRNIGVKRKVSEYRQRFAYAEYRVTNIGQAARYIDGTLLMPGEEFSMNDTIKERTPENGYTQGYVIGDGGVLRMDEGGGVSTATTAVYNAAWFAGLEFLEAKAHSIFIPRYEPGREATVSWGSLDMRFKNNTPYGIFITTEMENEAITVTMWSTKVWQKVGSKFGERTDVKPYSKVYDPSPECKPQDGMDGFRIEVTRTFYKKGKLVKAEPYATRYKPSPKVICGPDPNAPPEPVEPEPEPVPSGSSEPDPSTEPSAQPVPEESASG